MGFPLRSDEDGDASTVVSLLLDFGFSKDDIENGFDDERLCEFMVPRYSDRALRRRLTATK